MRLLAASLTLLLASCGGSGSSYEYHSAPVYNVSYGHLSGEDVGYISKHRHGYEITVQPHHLLTAILVHEFLHGLVDGPVIDHPPGRNFISSGEGQLWDLNLWHGPHDQWILDRASHRNVYVNSPGPLIWNVKEAVAWVNDRAGREVLTLAE